MIEQFKKFMQDEEAWDCYITGAAGTGKTTGLAKALNYCLDNGIEHVVCAYTHKACGILRSKLPEKANVMTLHKFLKKRPGINQQALKKQHIDINVRQGRSERPKVMFIDEYSMIGEKDGMDIRAEQDPEYEGAPGMKVVWIGDPNQLPPVGDMPFVRPYGEHQIRLTKIYRQASDNPLLGPLAQLVSFIEGTAELSPLIANDNFIREKDIVEEYKQCTGDKILLAFTNQRVEELNSEIQGYCSPKEGDKLFSPTTKQYYTFKNWVDYPTIIDTPFNGPLMLNSKYNTLEHIISSELCQFADVLDEDDVPQTLAIKFGHYQQKQTLDKLKAVAAASNRAIEQEYPKYKAAAWAKSNWKKPLARKRTKAWRDFMSYNECVVCLDFVHATTVHKSQGSTYDSVFVDTDDLYTCAGINMEQYLKLMYVAISRASNKVVTN